MKLNFSTLILPMILIILGCKQENTPETDNDSTTTSENVERAPRKPLSEDFKKYWYAGDAEITSYKLEQARYGEIRDGSAVLIYVTEPFLPVKQVKADGNNPDNISVLKLNATKNFLTGIYPYSIMGSTFYPVYDNQHAIKASLSVQEWCGHVYSQINNRDTFEYTSHSYFENEADQELSLEKSTLENEIWTKIRINPKDLPVGDISLIPSLESLRMGHQEIKAYRAQATLSSANGLSTYTLTYPDLERTLTIHFTSDHPYSIESWTEKTKSRGGQNSNTLITSASKIKTLKTAYWDQKSNKDSILRDSLGL
ncbi:septum formation inhibitor Maf [Allomuricauda sp. F6463D]|uniref:septum formation inhibitor Maf n=1 Tax=Allomuricauda sp. F6463D TaxID=2926409 RepID=UPI001FF4AC78|nr:septum formation inhibitor Maf [Muricauda sp. F6463D]MCK0159381.1 septum formation inhibitor Maf [Muricauda sp. F6463D]